MRLSTISFIASAFFTSVLAGAQPSLNVFPARDGSAAITNIHARNPLLARQNYILCSDTGYNSYCENSICCGTLNCMPVDAQCCTTGQWCPNGTDCLLVDGLQMCQGATETIVPSAALAGVTATGAANVPIATSTAPSSNTRPNTGAGQKFGPAMGALGVVGVVAALL